MSFEIDVGLASLQGRRERNEDFAGVQRAAAHEADRGWVAALADGVSTGGDGLMAAQTTVMALLSDFHATPLSWDASVALERLLATQNAWLAAYNRRDSRRQALCTLTAVALQGRRYAIAHVGDSRAWLLRDGACLQLTQDHRLERADFAGLTRAVGLDELLHLDHSQGELHTGDRLLLTSDGIHGVLRTRDIARLLREAGYALGATKFDVSVKVVVPSALSGIFASFLLALARGVGETMAVSIAAGQQPKLTLNPLSQIQTMTSFVVNVMKGDVEVGSILEKSIYAVALLLFLITLLMNMVSQIVLRRYREVYQ